ncbi:hypothetical protein BKA81DRAFT_74273 [Phyllosticta paracitricarpa]
MALRPIGGGRMLVAALPRGHDGMPSLDNFSANGTASPHRPDKHHESLLYVRRKPRPLPTKSPAPGKSDPVSMRSSTASNSHGRESLAAVEPACRPDRPSSRHSTPRSHRYTPSLSQYLDSTLAAHSTGQKQKTTTAILIRQPAGAGASRRTSRSG